MEVFLYKGNGLDVQSWQCKTSNAENAVCSEPSRRTIFILRESGLASLSPLLWPTGKELCLVKLQMRLGQSWHWHTLTYFEHLFQERWNIKKHAMDCDGNSGFVLKLPTCSASVGHWICFSNSWKVRMDGLCTVPHYISLYIILQLSSIHVTTFYDFS